MDNGWKLYYYIDKSEISEQIRGNYGNDSTGNGIVPCGCVDYDECDF